jgi:hypothetical protein
MVPMVSNPKESKSQPISKKPESMKRLHILLAMLAMLPVSADFGVSDAWAEIVATESDTTISCQFLRSPA